MMDRINPPKIEEIHKLHRMLEEAGIAHEYHPRPGAEIWDNKFNMGYQICVYDAQNEQVISVIEGMGTYGAEDDLLEIMGLLTEEEGHTDCVRGWLTAENVFERIMKWKGKS